MPQRNPSHWGRHFVAPSASGRQFHSFPMIGAFWNNSFSLTSSYLQEAAFTAPLIKSISYSDTAALQNKKQTNKKTVPPKAKCLRAKWFWARPDRSNPSNKLWWMWAKHMVSELEGALEIMKSTNCSLYGGRHWTSESRKSSPTSSDARAKVRKTFCLKI